MPLTRQEAMLRSLGITALSAIAVLHFFDLSHKLQERIAYMSVLFSLLIVASCALGWLLFRAERGWVRLVWAGAAGLAGSAMLGFVVSRTIALPKMGDHVGDWGSPIGLLSLGVEGGLVILAWYAIASQRAERSRDRRRVASTAAPTAGLAVLAAALTPVGVPPAADAHGGAAEADDGGDRGRDRGGIAHQAPRAAVQQSAHGGPHIPGSLKVVAVAAASGLSIASGVGLWRRSEPAGQQRGPTR